MGWNALADQAKRPLDLRAFWAGRQRKTMTQATKKQVKTLVRTTRRNRVRAGKIRGEKSPFTSSAAKYYPALKKLAER
jgi:hypothetical protein